MRVTPETGLPEPDTDSADHARQVENALRDVIGDNSISFAEFMQFVLYEPGLGYYVAGNRKFGPAGDFVTAPEVSNLFGHVIAAQCAALFEALGGGDILEPGAGSGALAASTLQRLAALDALPDRYRILEVSPELQERQKQQLNKCAYDIRSRVEWIAELPAKFRGVVIANEVADAIPVERFRIAGNTVQQARVGVDAGRFGWRFEPAPDALTESVRSIERDIGTAFPDGYQSEVSPGLRQWVKDLGDAVEQGVVLIFDYGMSRREYYAPDRVDGWLRCHFRHRAHSNPLILTGIQDITSWVDFTSIAESAVACGMSVGGYTSQAEFLLHGGLDTALAEANRLSATRLAEMSAEIKRLTLPGEMGENFKVIGLCRDSESPPALRPSDRAHLL